MQITRLVPKIQWKKRRKEKGEKKKEEEVEEINTRPFYNCFPGIERV